MTAAVPALNVDVDDFAQFVRSVAPDLLSYFRRRVVPADGAADCVAEVLLTLWRKYQDLPQTHSERRALSFGIAHNVLRNHTRSQWRGFALTERLGAQLASLPSEDINSRSGEVLEGLSHLRPLDRELILLVAWEGFSLGEAATILKISPTATRARYSRARARLIKLLDD